MNKEIFLFSINGTPRINNKAVDIPLSYLRDKKINANPCYFHGRQENQKIIEYINKKNNGIIVICVTVYNYNNVIEIIDKIDNNKKIIVFGEYVTQFYRELFEKSSKIDFAVLGDLEKPLEELYKCSFDYNKLTEYKNNIATIDNKDNKFAYHNKSFVMPAFDFLEFLSSDRRKRLEYVIQTKNDVCTGKCTFCRSRKGEIIFRELNHIFEEILIVNQKYGVQKIFFTDDNILDGGKIAVERLSKLCDMIIDNKLNLSLKCYFKANSIYTDELLQKMVLAGFTTIFVGIESGSSEDLVFYNKLTTIQDNHKVIKDLKEFGLYTQVGFLMFNPHSTLEKLKDNFYFMITHQIVNLFMWVSNVRIFRYTPMYSIAIQDNLLFDEQEYIDYKCTFKVKDKDAEKIYNFVMTKMYNRIFNIDYTFEFVYCFYLDVVQTHSIAKSYEEKLLNIKDSQFKRIKDFFEYLYVKNDLNYASKNYDKFLKTFEDEQSVLKDIYDKLLLIYIDKI